MEKRPNLLMFVQPRFKPRGFLRFNFGDIKDYLQGEIDVENFLKKITGKRNILNYSQLRIALMHFLLSEIPYGSNVVTSCYTIYDMVNVIISAGHNPIFVDIDKENLCPNINQIIKLVESKKVKAVIFTHLHGYNVSLNLLKKICNKNNCILIEDCAQSLWNPEWTNSRDVPGSYGDVALFSTGFFKAINSISGGYLLFNDSENKFLNLQRDYLEIKSEISTDFINRFIYGLIFYLLTSKFVFKIFLFPVLKYSRKNKIEFVNKRAREENNPKLIKRTKKSILKMNFFQRIFIKLQDVKKLNSDYQKRKLIANIYLEDLKVLIKRDKLIIPGVGNKSMKLSMNHFSIFYQIPVICKNPEKLIDYLYDNNIDIAKQHIKNLSNYNSYKKYSREPNIIADKISKNLILLPCYPNLHKDYIKKITNAILKFYELIDEKNYL